MTGDAKPWKPLHWTEPQLQAERLTEIRRLDAARNDHRWARRDKQIRKHEDDTDVLGYHEKTHTHLSITHSS
jgi:hypothetical protein